MSLYRELKVWNESVALIKEVYVLADRLPKSEDYNLKQQLKRAVVSVALNIAEGKGRRTVKEFSNFLNIAAGSLCEVEAILALCQELGYLTELGGIPPKIEVLGKMLTSFRNNLKSKEL